MANERTERLLADMREEIQEQEEAVATLKRTANMFATAKGLAEPYPDVSSATTSSGRRSAEPRPDQFANFGAPSTAARGYLEWRGRDVGSATAEQICDALLAGGYPFADKTRSGALNGLKIAMAKDSLVRRLPNGTYGLAAWYPQAAKPKASGKTDAAKDEKEGDADDFQDADAPQNE